MLPPLLLAGFLLAHGLIHTGFVSPRPPATAGGPPWPFALESSWAVTTLGLDPAVARLLGAALVVLVIGSFALAAIGSLGVLPAAVWPLATVVGALASIGLLVLFFHPWLVLGIAIDLALLWAVLVARWAPGWLAS